MRHSSKVSACRRGLNTHNVAKPRAPGHSRQRARLQAPVEPARMEQAPVPCPFTSTLRCISPPTLPKSPRHAMARSPPRQASGAGHQGLRFFWLAPRLCSLRAALPNPSFKPSPNGVPRGPGRRYAVHFRQPGPRVTPLVSA